MANPGTERRLTTIMAADVVGYSRLVEADETHADKAMGINRTDSRRIEFLQGR
jgi:class 3 adenylate cyclase